MRFFVSFLVSSGLQNGVEDVVSNPGLPLRSSDWESSGENGSVLFGKYFSSKLMFHNCRVVFFSLWVFLETVLFSCLRAFLKCLYSVGRV